MSADHRSQRRRRVYTHVAAALVVAVVTAVVVALLHNAHGQRNDTSSRYDNSDDHRAAAAAAAAPSYVEVEQALRARIAQLRQLQQTVHCTRVRARVRDARARSASVWLPRASADHVDGDDDEHSTTRRLVLLVLFAWCVALRALHTSVSACVQRVQLWRLYTTLLPRAHTRKDNSHVDNNNDNDDNNDNNDDDDVVAVARAYWRRGCSAEVYSERQRLLFWVTVKMCVAGALLGVFVAATPLVHATARYVLHATVSTAATSATTRAATTATTTTMTTAAMHRDDRVRADDALLASATRRRSRPPASSTYVAWWRYVETTVLRWYAGPLLLGGVVFWLTSMSASVRALARDTQARVRTQHALQSMDAAEQQARARLQCAVAEQQDKAAAQRHAELAQLIRDAHADSVARVLEQLQRTTLAVAPPPQPAHDVAAT